MGGISSQNPIDGGWRSDIASKRAGNDSKRIVFGTQLLLDMLFLVVEGVEYL